jgi:parallel beta-helix repeat protein
VGVYQVAGPNCCTISQNTLVNNRFFGVVIQDGDGTTSQNAITGDKSASAWSPTPSTPWACPCSSPVIHRGARAEVHAAALLTAMVKNW